MQNKLTYSEQELVTLLKQRESNAFEYLYDNYSAALYTVIVSILTDKEFANDILQEVFIKIWRQIQLYDEAKGRLFTWMINLTRNTSIDALRSKSYRNNKQNRELTEIVYESSGTTNIQVNEIGLRKLVYKLKDEHKVLIDLAYFQGFTHEEISKILNIPLGTVKTRLRAAMMQLRQIVKI
ncbi:MAG: sigma-70 family RNA polymerase sigma factor [Parafilimonas sp.]